MMITIMIIMNIEIEQEREKRLARAAFKERNSKSRLLTSSIFTNLYIFSVISSILPVNCYIYRLIY